MLPPSPMPQASPPAGPSSPPTGPGLGLLPAALSTPQRTPAVAPAPLPQPQPPTSPNTDPAHLPQPKDPQDLQNIFERRGALLALAVQEQGKRLADAMAQPPTNAVKLDNGQIADFWRFSPGNLDEASANQQFWQIHDQILVQTGDPQQAEQQAMQQVFPNRAALVGRGVASIDKQVETAQQIQRIVEGSSAPPARETALFLHAANNATNDQVSSY